MQETIITVSDFTIMPYQRFRTEGTESAEEFREDRVVPALEIAIREGGTVTINLDGTLGYGIVWPREVFGKLVSKHGFTKKQLTNHLRFINHPERPSYDKQILDYIDEAEEIRQAA